MADQSVIWVDRDACEALLKKVENWGYASIEALLLLEHSCYARKDLLMIFHTVLLRLKPETTAKDVEAALELVRALPQKIAGITNVIAGVNLHSTQKNQGYTYGFILVFDTEEHFRAYAPHPDHQPVSQALRRISQTIIDFDLLQE